MTTLTTSENSSAYAMVNNQLTQAPIFAGYQKPENPHIAISLLSNSISNGHDTHKNSMMDQQSLMLNKNLGVPPLHPSTPNLKQSYQGA